MPKKSLDPEALAVETFATTPATAAAKDDPKQRSAVTSAPTGRRTAPAEGARSTSNGGMIRCGS